MLRPDTDIAAFLPFLDAGAEGIDLVSLVRAIPAAMPTTLEIPTAELARTVEPLERARRVVARTHELLARACMEPAP